MSFKTADLCDTHGSAVRVLDPIFRHFGRRRAFFGPVRTLAVHEDNSLVRSALEGAGADHVLVIDGGGSMRCALVGDRLAQLASDHGWAGLVVFGAIRDSAGIEELDVGIAALGTHPMRSVKRGAGVAAEPVHFAGVEIRPGDYLYADEDGIVVASTSLTAGSS